ncbi:MAG: Flp family type IVb pilin [Ilumatobacteraceae bacterium]|jgi:Flp pilus assembly pilin Flp
MKKAAISLQSRLLSLRDGNDQGAGIAEYALLVALIAVVAIIGITTFGEQLADFFGTLPGKLGF